MHGRSCTCLLAITVLMLTPGLVRGQSERADPAHDFALPLPPRMIRAPIRAPIVDPLKPRLPTTPLGTNGFPLLVHAAGVIFSGTVAAIARRPAIHGQTVETVAVTFHVENAIRGATPGQDLTISQWIGLWSGGQRYRVGERVLLFLYPASKLGLTSCVAGAMGRMSIDSWGRVSLSAQHQSAFQTDPVVGGKSQLRFSDVASAVRRASEEE
jgi:hypothetical protein